MAAPPRDLREWMDRVDRAGLLKRITEEVERTKICRSVYEQVAAKWAERDFARTLPRLWALEE